MSRLVRRRLIACVLLGLVCLCGWSCAGDSDSNPGDGDTTDGDEADGDEDAVIEPPVQADCAANSAPFPRREEPATPASLPWLKVKGRDIVDEDDRPVMLRGINFGAWLMNESWLAGLGRLEQKELLALIEEKADELGLGELLLDAKGPTALECGLNLSPYWTCVMSWRAYMEANSGSKAEKVAEFWDWFDSEPWVFEERSLWNHMTREYGYARSEELRHLYYDVYVKELDVERFAALGLNLIRVPIWYQALETDREGENGFYAKGWEKLDELVEWARKHGVYLMLDLHGAPGGQSPWWHQGLENGGRLWNTQACIDKTARLWKAIASYFKDEPHVAVYDLLNEPFGAPDKETYRTVHDALYKAIRDVDTQHIVMIEDGFLDYSKRLTSPKEMGWENAMMSFHAYPGSNSPESFLAGMENEFKNVAKVFDRFDCPIFYGEFNVYPPTAFSATDGAGERWQPAAMRAVLTRMNARGIHWAPWSWKYFAYPSLWGPYTPKPEFEGRLTLKDADFETVREYISKLGSENFRLDEAYGQVLEDTADAPYAPLDLSPWQEGR